MLLIGSPIQGDAFKHALAWEMAEQLHKAPDSSFMNISQETGTALYKGSQSKAEIVSKKRLTDQQVLEQYLGDYKQRIIVEGNSVDKFLGHYSLTTTVHPFSAGILLLKGNVLCVVGGDNRPSYIFDAGAGTLERTENLYTSLYSYVPDNAPISAYIVSTETMPVAIKLEEEEAAPPLPPQKKSTKRAILEEEKKEESPKKKKAALVEEKEKIKEEEEEEEANSSPKKIVEEEKVPSSPPVKKKKKSEEDEAEAEREGKSGKKSAAGRSRHRRKLATEGQK